MTPGIPTDDAQTPGGAATRAPAPQPVAQGNPRQPAAAAPSATAPARVARTMPPSGLPDYANGTVYQQLRAEMMRSAARAGGVDSLVRMSGELDRMHKTRVGNHMQSAILLSQQGDRMGAAQEMQRATYLMSPGYKTRVSPGPDNTFVFQNYDAKDDRFVGAAAYSTDALMEMYHAYKDVGSYQNFRLSRAEAGQRMSMAAELHPLKVAEAHLSIEAKTLANQRASLENTILAATGSVPGTAGRGGSGGVGSSREDGQPTPAAKRAGDVYAEIEKFTTDVVGHMTQAAGADASPEDLAALGGKLPNQLPFWVDPATGKISSAYENGMRAIAEALVSENQDVNDSEIAGAIKHALLSDNYDIAISEVEFVDREGHITTRNALVLAGMVESAYFLPANSVDMVRNAVFGQRLEQARLQAAQSFQERSGITVKDWDNGVRTPNRELLRDQTMPPWDQATAATEFQAYENIGAVAAARDEDGRITRMSSSPAFRGELAARLTAQAEAEQPTPPNPAGPSEMALPPPPTPDLEASPTGLTRQAPHAGAAAVDAIRGLGGLAPFYGRPLDPRPPGAGVPEAAPVAPASPRAASPGTPEAAEAGRQALAGQIVDILDGRTAPPTPLQVAQLIDRAKAAGVHPHLVTSLEQQLARLEARRSPAAPRPGPGTLGIPQSP